MSVISGRYAGSPESSFDSDIRRIDEMGFAKYFENVESAELSDARWNSGLPPPQSSIAGDLSFIPEIALFARNFTFLRL